MLSRKNKKRVYRRSIFYYLFYFMLFFVTPIAICSWILSDVVIYENIKADFKPSGLTDYINGLSSGTSNYIYDNSVNYNDPYYQAKNQEYIAAVQAADSSYSSSKYKIDAAEDENGYLGYNIDSDFTYINGDVTGTSSVYVSGALSSTPNASGLYSYIWGKTKTIELGNPFSTTVLDKSVHFTHTNSQIDYSDVTKFYNGDGCTDSSSTGLTSNSFFQYTSVSNGAFNENVFYNRWNRDINYHYSVNFSNTRTTVTASHKYGNASNASSVTARYVVPYGRLYTIKLVGDLTISSGSTLSIGAKIGSAGASTAGACIEGDFVALDLNGHTITISSGARLNAYGYIYDSKLGSNGKHIGSIINNGTMYGGFVVEDFGGGGNTVGRGFASQMPFSQYSTPYLLCKMVHKHGSSFYLTTMLYANALQNTTTLNWYGSSSSFFLQSTSSGSSLVIDNYNASLFTNPGSKELYNENMLIYYDFSGNFVMNTLSLQIDFEATLLVTFTMPTTISMAQFSFMIPSYTHLTLKSGSTFDLNMHLEFLPGATLHIEENATLNLSSVSYLSQVQDIPVYGDRVIAQGTSYGGISVPTQMPPTSATSYYVGNSNYLYNFTASYYQDYEIEEKERIENNDPRVIIDGNISVTNNNLSYHVFSGLMKLSSSVQTYLANNYNDFSFLYVDEQTFGNVTGASALVSWVQDGTFPTTIYYGGYTIQPLVVSNADNSSNSNLLGRTFMPNTKLSSLLSSDVYYDLRNGYYFDITNNKYFIYALNEGSGTAKNNNTQLDVGGEFVEIEALNDDFSISYNSSKYIFFEDTFVETNIQDLSLNGNGLYVYDSATSTYNRVTNSKVFYTYSGDIIRRRYRYSANTTGNRATRVRTQHKGWFTNWTDKSLTDWSNTPATNVVGAVLTSTQDTIVGTDEERSATVDVISVSGTKNETTSVSQSAQIANLSVISQTDITYDNYVLTDLTCSLHSDGTEQVSGYGTWTAIESENGSTTYQYNNRTENVTAGIGDRTRTEYLDWCYFYHDVDYIKGYFDESNISLYSRCLSTGQSLKYTSSTGLWTK